MLSIFKFLFKIPEKKYYGHIISLGYNCEVSFQFFKQYHFVESSLFAWANVINIKNLIYALKNLDKVCGGDLINVNPMWKCLNTNIHFHGIAPASAWQNSISEYEIEEDKKELVSRIKYLKQKFINTACDRKKNLYIFKYLIKDETEDVVKQNIKELYDVIDSICINDFDLLIILEEKYFQHIKMNIQNLHIRSVIYFAPEDDVTKRDKILRSSYRKIFREFRPSFKLKKTKHFKFEDR